MLTRRSFTVSLAALAGSYATAKTAAPGAEGAKHTVLMLNADCNDRNILNVFDPAILHVDQGDSVTFLATDPSHNSASKRGMIPNGAAPWNGGIDEEITVTLKVPGIYGYLCLPHYELGMVGLIVVARDLSNLAQVKKVRHPGRARTNFRTLLNALQA
ncbi:pseudoazurin [Tateyamaria omphalii]|uniref:Pseudoazurin n=1 Tax=Tateyamaria omphalii TaxID=299262 RepID=A0A1P8N1D6_9RHOB|nr:pseudoazurin [Tateyamaria omphalii]APX14113.1 pseudoazurin [Tateyamaria omphalii]